MAKDKDTYVADAILSCLRKWKNHHDNRYSGKSYTPPWYVADCDLKQLEEWAEYLRDVWDRSQEFPINRQQSVCSD